MTGSFGTTAYGASILNCKSEISGANVAGFIGKTGAYMGASASDDRDGVIANCIAVGDTGKGHSVTAAATTAVRQSLRTATGWIHWAAVPVQCPKRT